MGWSAASQPHPGQPPGPLRYTSYAVGCRRFAERWHSAVRLDADVFHRFKVRLTSMALTIQTEGLEQALRRLPVELNAALRRQLFELLCAASRARQIAGLEWVTATALRLYRRSVPATIYGGPISP